MDLDLAQVRAFVVAAEHLHFGRAAKDLSLSQQALSARISRLEGTLGVKLFSRGSRGVGLTAPGRQFLHPARQLLAAGDRAAEAARTGGRPLRMSVWGNPFFAAQSVQALADGPSGPRMEVGTCDGMAAAVAALRRGEIDVAFGRVDGAGAPPGVLARRLIRLDAMAVVVNAGHPLADRAELSPGELRGTPLWLPAPLESLDFLRQFVERFRLTGRFGGVSLGAYHVLCLLDDDPGQVALVPARLKPLGLLSLRLIPLVDPTPRYGSWLLWRRDERHPEFERLLQRVDAIARRDCWLGYDPERDWLAAAELAEITSATR